VQDGIRVRMMVLGEALQLNNYMIFIEPGTGTKGLSPARQRGGEVAKQIMNLYQESWS